MSMWLKSLLAAGCALASSQALAQSVSIDNLRYGGTGCARDTVDVRLIDDGRGGFPEKLDVDFSAFVARQGPGIPLRDIRKICNIYVDLQRPRGWQFAITNVVYRGNAALPAGVFGQLRSTYEFPLFSPEATLQAYVAGPLRAQYLRHDELGADQLVWSPCGLDVSLNIGAQIILRGSRERAASTSFGDNVRYGLAWRRCGSSGD